MTTQASGFTGRLIFHRLAIVFVAIAAFALVGTQPVFAQALPGTVPNAGRLQQELRPPVAPPPEVTVPPILAPTQPKPAAPAGSGDARVNVTGFDFTGNSALSSEVLRQALVAWTGRALNFGDLIEAVEAVEARYKQAGYFLAQGVLPPQKIKDGVIEIAVSEGRLGETRLEGESRVSSDVVFGYLDRLPKGQALTLPVLERQVLLINELAGGRASLDLQAGDEAGSTDVVLAQQPEELISGRLELSNYGSPSTGGNRLSLNLNANSAFHLGERITASAMTTDTQGLASYGLRGELPVGSAGWRLTAAATGTDYSLGGAFANLLASGFVNTLRAGVGYPLIRSRASNLKLLLEADTNKLVDKYKSTNTQIDKRIRGLTLTVSADALDEFFGGGSTRADLALRSGNLTFDLTDPGAFNADQLPAGPRTAGAFSKATLIAQRQQTVTRELSLQGFINLQATNKNLDSSEKLTLGGPATLPGYANGEASGDEGVLVKLSLRWQAMSEFALSVFADYGQVQMAHSPFGATVKNHRHLSDAGLSADWVIGKGFTASAIAAWAGQEPPNPADNDRPRFWVTLGYGW